MENKNSKIHYAWYILAACFLLNMTVHVMVMQIASLYMVPMAQGSLAYRVPFYPCRV